MKPLEILSRLPDWAGASPAALLDSPAWAMPCRLGEETETLRKADVRPCDTLDLSVSLDGERHLLAIADSPRFPNLHSLWATRADIPGPILLALMERECGALLQLVENAVRRQLRIEGRSDAGPDDRTLFAQTGDAVFGLTRSPAVETALGQLRFIDTAHPDVRGRTLPCETEFASFALPEADLASLSIGDALLLPEIGSVPPRIVVAGLLVADGNGVAPYADDGRLRVLGAEPRDLTLGELFDRAESPAAETSPPPPQLRLVAGGREIARGRLGRLASQPAFFVEALA